MKSQLLKQVSLGFLLFLTCTIGVSQVTVKSEYLFTGGSLDNSGDNTNSLTQTGTALMPVTGIDNMANNAISLNGDALNAPSYVSHTFDKFSIAFWIKTSDVSSTEKEIISHNGSGTDNYGWKFSLQDGNLKSWMRFYDTGRQPWQQIAPHTNTYNNIADGNWHFIVLTMEKTTPFVPPNGTQGRTRYKMYVDTSLIFNQLMTRFAVGGINSVPNSDLFIGDNFSLAANRYTDDIDNIRYYHGLLSNSEINNLYLEFDNPNQLTRSYVDQNATGNNDGSSWADAFTNLQDGITAAPLSMEKSIWVAQGTYKPGTSRGSTFSIAGNDLKLYGGFNGTETQLDQRDITANPTIISGDIDGDDNPNDVTYNSTTRDDNSYRLFVVNGNDVELNGFTLKGGQANNTGNNSQNRGAAVFKNQSAINFSIKNCVITENVTNVAGTLYLRFDQNSSLTIEACEFFNNLGRYGGGFDASAVTAGANLDVQVNNCSFYNNVSGDITGAGSGFSGSSFSLLLNNGSTINATITNNTFTNNVDSSTNSAIDKGTVVLRRLTSNDVLNVEMHNNIFWNNFSDDSGTVNPQNIAWMNGSQPISSLHFTHNNSNQTNLASKATSLTNTNNLDTDPLFVDEANFDLQLQGISPMIDAGDNAQIPSGVTMDLAGNNRIENITVDLGAFEFSGPAPDTTPPTVLTQDITVQLDANGQVAIQPSDVDNGSTDDETAQADLILSLDTSSFDCNAIGQNTITLTVEDEAGNTASDTATVTVEDVDAPTVITQDITVQLDANGQASITANVIDNGSTDNCGIANLALDMTSFDCSNLGANTVTLSAEDAESNTGQATATVTVVDVDVPTVVTQDITVQLDANGQASITANDIDNGSTDNCGIANLSLDVTNFDCSNLGANTVTLSAEDTESNTGQATATVTVVDVDAPTVVTQDITVQLDANGQVSITTGDIDNGSTDNCGIANLALDVTNFDCSNLGANTVTLSAEDAESNTGQATATVTVEDVDAPTVITQDITVQLDANGQANITANDIDNGSTDNCGIANLSLDMTSFDCSNLGANTVTLSAEDTESNTGQATATVTVVDVDVPTVVTQDITVQLDANGQVSITTGDIDNGSTDNCGIANLALDVTNFDCSNLGANTVTLSAEDTESNTGQATATVTVEDVDAPTVITQDITVQLDANGQASITTGDIDNGSTDNCGIANLALDVTNFDCSNLGANTVTLSAEDAESNTGQATVIVTVVDDLSPSLSTQDITVFLNGNPSVSIVPNDVLNTLADNCATTANIMLGLDQDTFTSTGIYTVNLTATDDNGNSTSEPAQVTVDETLSTPETSFKDSVKLYPNPATARVNVSAQTSIDQIELIDQTGRVVLKTTQVEFDVSPFSSGIYFVRITSENAQVVKRLIKR